MSKAKNLIKDDFDTNINKGVALVDFWAEWCGPCKAMAPTIDALADENPDLNVFKVDIDHQPELAARFNVRSIPTLILFKDGASVDLVVGSQDKSTLEGLIKKHTLTNSD